MTPDEKRLRAMLAGQALAGLTTSKVEWIAQDAVAYADAVMDRLMKTGGAL